MLEELSQNIVLIGAGLVFLLLLFYLMFAFSGFIPHFLVSTYMILPLFYKLSGLPPLPLTSVFALLLGPIVIYRASSSSIKLLWPVFLYLLVVLVCSLVNGSDVWDNKSMFIPIIISFLCGISLCTSINSTNRLEQFCFTVILWVFVNSAFSILQITKGQEYYLISATKGGEVGGIQRGYGLIGMATQIGVFFCLGVPLIGAFLFGNRGRHLLFAFLFSVSSIALILTFSRGAILGVGVSFIGLLYFFGKHRLLTLYVAILLTIVVGYSSLTLFLPSTYSQFLQARDSSAKGRVPFVIIGLKMFAERPLAGFGYGGFYENCVQYGAAFKIEAHNTYIQVLVEYGLFGFATFMMSVWISISGYLHYIKFGNNDVVKTISIGLLSGLVAILLDAIVHCVEWNLILWLPLSLGLFMNYLSSMEKAAANRATVAAPVPSG